MYDNKCPYNIKKAAKFLARMTMIPDMDAGKTEFLEKAYGFLKLNDNNRIIEKEKCGMKLAEDISNHIYENIINIVAEEIYEKDNMEAFDLFMDYYKKRFPNMESAIGYSTDPKSLEKYISSLLNSSDSAKFSCTMLYLLIYGKSAEAQNTVMRMLEECFTETEFFGPDLKGCMEKTFGIEKLKSDRQYDKFLSEQRKKITDYLDIKYGDLEKYILNYAFPGIASCPPCRTP